MNELTYSCGTSVHYRIDSFGIGVVLVFGIQCHWIILEQLILSLPSIFPSTKWKKNWLITINNKQTKYIAQLSVWKLIIWYRSFSWWWYLIEFIVVNLAYALYFYKPILLPSLHGCGQELSLCSHLWSRHTQSYVHNDSYEVNNLQFLISLRNCINT